jgi:transcription antitermination factor NusA-like protein
MSSPFEYYFPPIFFSKELSEEDNKRYELFIECMSSPSSPFSSSDTESKMSDDSDDSEIEMMVENKDIGKVIGKGGDTISKIRMESGANIKIFDKRFGTKRKIKIYGRDSNVQLAKEKIINCLPIN